MNKGLLIFIILLAVALFVAAVLFLLGYFGEKGPLSFLKKGNNHPGNDRRYDINTVSEKTDSPLKGKTILFLGSSVTLGTASQGISFADYVSKQNGAIMIKEAVGGTTLSGQEDTTYVSRLMERKEEKVDLFVCQLSTNDASKNKTLGSPADNDRTTVLGAINYICDYVEKRWHCPIVFYTNSYFESDRYAAMVRGLKEIANTRKIVICDLYSDADFNNIDKEERTLYMADAIHPTKAGYLLWWTPKIEKTLYEAMVGNKTFSDK